MAATPIAIAFLGQVLPESWCSQMSACSPAANRDSLCLLKAIHQATGVAPAVFTVQPIGVYPRSRHMVVPAVRRPLTEALAFQLIPFINLLLLKQVTIAIMSFFFLMRWLWLQRTRKCYVIVQNVYAPMALPVLLATRLLGGHAVALVMDLPHNLSYDFSGLYGRLRRLNWFAETRSLAYFRGLIAYTRFIGADYAPHVPMLVMEGGVAPHDLLPPPAVAQLEQDDAPTGDPLYSICFSGTLSAVNGIDLLLAAFARLPEPAYRLWVFGRGPLEAQVRAAAERDARICYFGFLPDQLDVQRYQRQATVLVNLRLKNDLINRYTFPSKLREYMLSGRPVITTSALGIPEEYHDLVYLLHEESADGLARCIRQVCAESPATLHVVGRRAYAFIVANKSWTLQGRRVRDFLARL